MGPGARWKAAEGPRAAHPTPWGDANNSVHAPPPTSVFESWGRRGSREKMTGRACLAPRDPFSFTLLLIGKVFKNNVEEQKK